MIKSKVKAIGLAGMKQCGLIQVTSCDSRLAVQPV